MRKHIIIINGPNLNLLGKREKSIYGDISFETYLKSLMKAFQDVEINYFQSNHEGDIIDKIHEVGFDVDGIVLNAGALTHTSIAIRDAVAAINSPVVEVHISNIYDRESFRWQNFLKDVCIKSIIGKGLDGYKEAVKFLLFPI